jgi:hypothetical protein
MKIIRLGTVPGFPRKQRCCLLDIQKSFHIIIGRRLAASSLDQFSFQTGTS